MLTYVLKDIVNEIKSYYFYPEGNKNAEGIVSINTRTGDKRIDLDSPDDVKGYYAYHALCGIDLSKNNGTIAWC